MNFLDDKIPYWGPEPDAGTKEQMRRCAATADKCAFMADNHLGYAVPIGGVVAYKDYVSPSAVGYDIACGNKAICLDVDPAYVRENISSIMDDVFATISFGIGRNNDEKVDHAVFDDKAWSELDVLRPLRGLAKNQLGTVGAGNHYVDIFIDENQRVWIGVHFGSRGLGHKTTTWFLNAIGAKDAIHAEPSLLALDSDLGAQYWRAMTIAGQYAYAGRNWVCDRVRQIIGGEVIEEVHNHHNFAWLEHHNDERYCVVRKGATPAFPYQSGFVGGSMSEPAVILQGKSDRSDEQQIGLFSTVHGAGRALGRAQAKGRRTKDGKAWKREPLVTADMMNQAVSEAGVELRGAGVDESPHCYKRLPDVLDAHKNTIEIVHTLYPIGVAMAGPRVKDPYKD